MSGKKSISIILGIHSVEPGLSRFLQAKGLSIVSPWTDLTMSGETIATKDARDPIIHKGYLGELADAHPPAGTDRKK